jgi:membrane fusion protein (multidrug efflux system)
MLKRFILTFVLLGLVFGGVIGFKLFKQSAMTEYLSNMGTPPVHLNATVAKAETWPQHLAAIGSLRARKGIDIRSEADGVIRKLHIVPGQWIAAGELMVELDDTVDRATLKSADVRLQKARRDFERDRALFERELVSEDQFESRRSEFESAQAFFDETQGIIDKKSIRAPFASSIGIHNLAEGHYLSRGDNVVSLQDLDTLYLDMKLPEKELENLRLGQQVLFSVPSHPGRSFTGVIRFIDVQVQATTRNVLVRAEVDNPQHELLPGMFADVTVVLNQSFDVVTLPRTAVAFTLYGETVYLLEETTNAEAGTTSWKTYRKPVKSSETRDGRLAVTGIDVGQLVALDTQHRLLEGSPVVIENLAALDVSVPKDDRNAPTADGKTPAAVRQPPAAEAE